MIDSLVSTPSIQLLERTLDFTERRNEVIMENLANISTPGYIEKDMSVQQFQNSLREAAERQRSSPGLTPELSVDEVPVVDAPNSVPFHDRGVRSMENLQTQLADNGLAHNMTAQLLRGRYDTLNRAISMKV